MMKHRYFKPLFFLLCAFLFAAFAGCGKKGPPLLPLNTANKVAAPYEVKLTRMGDDVHLVWKHKIDEKTAAAAPEMFEIFMAQKNFDDCEGCPFTFKSVGVVDMPGMEFFVPVLKGYKYYFRIQAVDDDNMRSPYSETVQFEFK